MEAVKFPTVEVNFSDGSSLKLPITSDTMNVPKVSMLCLSFRANSQVLYIYILVDDCLFVDAVRWNQASKSEHWLFLCLFIILPNFMKSAHGNVPKLRGYFVHYSRYILPRKIGCINLAAEGNLDFL